MSAVQVGDISRAALRFDEVEELLRVGMRGPHCSPTRGYATGWLLPQRRKQRRRPIFEPYLSRLVDGGALPRLRFRTRLERRARLVGGGMYAAWFGVAAYCDQLPLPASCRSPFPLRAAATEGPSV